MENIVLETGSLHLEFSEKNGALVYLKAKDTGWVIHRRSELGLSWQLLVPLGDLARNNPVLGEKQALTSWERGEDYVRFAWDGVESEKGGLLDIRVETEVRAAGRRAEWRTRIVNRSPYIVESALSPRVGDLTRPDADGPFKTFMYDYGSATELNLWPTYDNQRGDWGIEHPMQIGMSASPCSPYFLMRSEGQGLYAGLLSDRAEYVAWSTELLPGYSSSITSLVPEGDEIAGQPVHTIFNPIHMCYVPSGESFDLTPIALEAYQGSWQAGVDIYKAWRDTWMVPAKAPQWARDPHAWLQIHINSPESELRLRYADIPKVAAECARHGITAIQLVGWNRGGQDRGNPSHDHDPRLGTYAELQRAIAESKKLGVRIILFCKFTWGDVTEDLFRKELSDCAVMDPFGDWYVHGGYQYFTPAQWLDVNKRRLASMCFGSRKYIDACKREFAKAAGTGCEGILYDECQHHGGGVICFDTRHGHKYGYPVHQGDLGLAGELLSVQKKGDDFLLAGEACYDWEFQKYMFSYFRSRNVAHKPVSRYMQPFVPMATAVSGFDDRDMINQCLMCRYVISYEPYYFKGWPHDFPETVTYGEKMDELRKELRDYLWDGEYRDTCGATVTVKGGGSHANFARFQRQDGDSALVVCNYGGGEVTLLPALEKGQLTRYRLVDDDTWHTFGGEITLPAHSAAVVL